MPRNVIGGNRAKKQGNKHGGRSARGNGGQFAGVRRAAEGELYAVATKVYGGGRAMVTGHDGLNRRLEIRGKFRGRNRRQNEVRPGGLVLVGDRLWAINESTNSKSERVCDLLYVYSMEEVRTLQREGTLGKALLKQVNDADDEDSGINFDSNCSGNFGNDDEALIEQDEFDPYAGMPSFSDEENDDEEGPTESPTEEGRSPVIRQETSGGGLFEDDDDVDEDDI